MQFQPYDGEQIRELINSEQLYGVLLAAQLELDQGYRGSIAWKQVRGHEYLYRKRKGDWRSLGPRSEATESIHAAFVSGRAALKEKVASLEAKLARSARVNRAMGLGRVPFIAARLARRLADRKLLGERIVVVGTPALFAYERMAGGRLHASLIATDDIDLLYDARHEIRLLADDRDNGLIGILRSLDKSFAPIGPGAFSAANAHGFMVDLITPVPAGPALAKGARLGKSDADLKAAEIHGLDWLQNSPRVTQTVIDEKGYPLRLVVPDPRAFALHKLWVSGRPSREPVKARRDRMQALTVAALLNANLPHLRFDDGELGSFPAEVRALLPHLREARLAKTEEVDWR